MEQKLTFHLRSLKSTYNIRIEQYRLVSFELSINGLKFLFFLEVCRLFLLLCFGTLISWKIEGAKLVRESFCLDKYRINNFSKQNIIFADCKWIYVLCISISGSTTIYRSNKSWCFEILRGNLAILLLMLFIYYLFSLFHFNFLRLCKFDKS